jgi:hypothetical protein
MQDEKTTVRREARSMKADDFDLKLPKELDPQPKWAVDMPRSMKAEVFESTRDAYNNHGKAVKVRKGYTVVLRRKDGRIYNDQNYRTNHRADNFYSTALDVRNALIALSFELLPKKLRTVVDDYEE